MTPAEAQDIGIVAFMVFGTLAFVASVVYDCTRAPKGGRRR